MARFEQTHISSTPAIDDESQNDPNTTSIATANVNRRMHDQACRASAARNASGRLRYVDPTTTDRDYSSAEMEFMQAMVDYKRTSGRMFPTWSEVLEVLQSLGYQKLGTDRPGLGGLEDMPRT